MDKKFLNLVFITDNNYVMPTIVAITSLAENRFVETNYNISILTKDLNQENYNLLNNIKYENIHINIIKADNILNEYINKIPKKRHVTLSALLKMFLPNIFNNLDKILYLDSDILVQTDLQSLYNTDISDFYGAVVKDTFSIRNRDYMNKYHINNEFYFNTGVMLLNLKKMREDDITVKLLEHKLANNSFFMDQDNFNAVIGSNVKFLSYKYNFLNYFIFAFPKTTLSAFFNEDLNKSDKDIYKTCSIIHLGGKEKPWIYDMPYLSKIYKYYYKKTVFKDKRLKLKKHPEYLSKVDRIFSYYEDPMRKDRYVIHLLGFKIKTKKKLHKTER